MRIIKFIGDFRRNKEATSLFLMSKKKTITIFKNKHEIVFQRRSKFKKYTAILGDNTKNQNHNQINISILPSL